MQNYVDALVAHNNNELAKAEAECKATREKIKAKEALKLAVVAKILGVQEREIEVVKRQYESDGFGVKKWPGVFIQPYKHKAWAAHRDEIKKLESRLQQCCNAEKLAKERNSEKSMFAFRRFIRARFGQKPTAPAKQVVAEFIDSTTAFACKAK